MGLWRGFAIGGVGVAALLLGALIALWHEPATAPFSIMSSADGATIWRLDNRTGKVSICAIAIAGRALVESDMQLAAHIRDAGNDKAAQLALSPEIDALNSLSRPHCSEWSLP